MPSFSSTVCFGSRNAYLPNGHRENLNLQNLSSIYSTVAEILVKWAMLEMPMKTKTTLETGMAGLRR